MTKKEHLNGLELLRYLLGMYIVLYHTFHYQGVPEWCSRLVEMGFAATSSFFILSGFILSYVYLSGNGTEDVKLKEKKRSFLWKRFANLYPIHIFSLIFTLLVVYSMSQLVIDPKDASASIRYVMYDSNNYTPVEKLHHYMSNAEMWLAFAMNAFLVHSWNPYYLTFNAPAWSISTLFFMYIIFPFVAPYLSKLKKPVLGLFVMNAIYLALPVLFIVNGLFDMPYTGILNRNPLARLPEFLSGVVLCAVYFSLKKRNIRINTMKVRLFIVIVALVLFCLGNILLHNPDWITRKGNAPYYLLHNGLLLIPECLVILIFASLKINKSRMLSLLGGASLPLFALHIPVYHIFTRTELYFLGEYKLYLYPLFLVLVTILCVLFQEKLVVPTRKKILKMLLKKDDK